MKYGLLVFLLTCSIPIPADIVKPKDSVLNGLVFRAQPDSSSKTLSALWPKYGDYGFLLDDSIPYYYKIQFDGMDGYVSKRHSYVTKAVNERPATTPKNNEMVIHFINVGQGDATLVEFQCGALLVDLGGETNNGFKGEERLISYLDQFFQRRTDLEKTFDLLAITHPHIDHTTAAKTMDQCRFTRLLTNGHSSTRSGAKQRKLEEYARANDIEFSSIALENISDQAGLTINDIEGFQECRGTLPKITALWGHADHAWSDDPNDHSIALKIELGASSLLLTGDAEEPAMKKMIAKYAQTDLLDIDIYQLGHHGSKNGTIPELAKAITPVIAVGSQGNPDKRQYVRGRAFNSYKFGHPNIKAVEALLPHMSETSRTAKSVSIGIKGTFNGIPPSEFKSMTIDKALYNTGWDGGVVIKANTQEAFQVRLINF